MSEKESDNGHGQAPAPAAGDIDAHGSMSIRNRAAAIRWRDSNRRDCRHMGKHGILPFVGARHQIEDVIY